MAVKCGNYTLRPCLGGHVLKDYLPLKMSVSRGVTCLENTKISGLGSLAPHCHAFSHAHACTRTLSHARAHVRTCASTCVHACTHTHTHTYARTRTHTHTCTHTHCRCALPATHVHFAARLHANMHACMHTCIGSCTCTHTHMPRLRAHMHPLFIYLFRAVQRCHRHDGASSDA